MGKLITPVDYERRLDRLNQLRPLHRVSVVQPVVSLPVLCVSDVDDDGLLDGKVLRCVDGSVLSSQPKHFTKIEAYNRSTSEGSPLSFHITFSQRVGIVQIQWTGIGAPGAVRIRDETDSYNLHFMGSWGVYYWPLNGWEIYFRINDAGAGFNEILVSGFY